MITKIFCYNENVAKEKCKVKKTNVYVKLCIMFLVLSIFCLFLIMVNYIFSMIMFFGLLLLGIYYEVKAVLSMNDKMTAISIDQYGNVYKSMVIDKGVEFGLLGIAGGRLLSDVFDNEAFSVVGSTAGAYVMLKGMNNAAKVMKVPDNVFSMINHAKDLTGVITYKIFKIHTVTNLSKKIILYCDYELLGKNKIKINKKVVIKKVYNNYDELENMIIGRNINKNVL